MEEPFSSPKGSDPLNQIHPGSGSSSKKKDEATSSSKKVMEKEVKVPTPFPGWLAMKMLMDIESACIVDIIDPMVQEYLEIDFLQDMFLDLNIIGQDELEVVSICDLFTKQGLSDEEISKGIMAWCEKTEFVGAAGTLQLPSSLDPACILGKDPLPAEESPPKVELKPLPPDLKYVYMGESETQPEIINNELSEEKE